MPERRDKMANTLYQRPKLNIPLDEYTNPYNTAAGSPQNLGLNTYPNGSTTSSSSMNIDLNNYSNPYGTAAGSQTALQTGPMYNDFVSWLNNNGGNVDYSGGNTAYYTDSIGNKKTLDLTSYANGTGWEQAGSDILSNLGLGSTTQTIPVTSALQAPAAAQAASTGMVYTPPDYSGKVQGIYDPLRQRQTTQYEGGLASIKAAYDKVMSGLNNQAPLVEQQAAESLNQNDIGYYQGKQNLAAAMEAAGQRGGENITGNVGLSAMRGTGINQINQIKANNLKAISDAVAQALADQAAQQSGLTTQYQGDMSMIDSEQAKAIQDAEQQGAVNAMNLAGILGKYTDPATGIQAPTMELQRFDYGKTQDSIDNAREDTRYADTRGDVAYNRNYQQGKDTLENSRYTDETAYSRTQDQIRNDAEALDKEKAEFVNTIGQYYADYQSQIDKLTNDNDTSNDWQLPYLKAARAEKVAAQEAAQATAQAKAAADQNAQSKAMYDDAFNRWKTSGKVLTQADANILGVPVGSQTEAYTQAQMSNKVAQQNANTASTNATNNATEATNRLAWDKDPTNPKNIKTTKEDPMIVLKAILTDLDSMKPSEAYKELLNNPASYAADLGSTAEYNRILNIYKVKAGI
jgi:hypothetical protein